MKILADASLPNLSIYFKKPFMLTLYHTHDELVKLLPAQDILLCRSTLNVTKDLLHQSALKCVATASSGIDHIDCNYLKNNQITLFDTKGSNARAVADYVIATLASLYHKNNFIGQRAGIIGMGNVGTQVLPRLKAMGFEALIYDPPRAELDQKYPYATQNELFSCDVLCIHANLHNSPQNPSFNLFSEPLLSKLKPNVVIINASRGGIVNEIDLTKTSTPIIYCTDVYLNEPQISSAIIHYSSRCTPHIAGHSIEAKDAAVKSISQQLHQYFNLPNTTSSPILDKSSFILHNDSWIDFVLNIYDPIHDTIRLKQTKNITHAFLTQRKKHQHRHDFNYYDASKLNKVSKRLLGHE